MDLFLSSQILRKRWRFHVKTAVPDAQERDWVDVDERSCIGRGRNKGNGASIRSQKQALSWGFAVSQGSEVECFEPGSHRDVFTVICVMERDVSIDKPNLTYATTKAAPQEERSNGGLAWKQTRTCTKQTVLKFATLFERAQAYPE